MFTQISLSLDSNNYILKIKLNDEAINFFLDKKEDISKMIESISEESPTTDVYSGEYLGLAYSEVSHDEMLKKLSRLKNYFESQGLTVFDIKLVTLATRLKQLETIDNINHQLLSSITK